MQSDRLELFWVEKIKLTQYMINKIDKFYSAPPEGKTCDFQFWKTNITQLLATERRSLGFLVFSYKLSSILPLPPLTDADVEKDMVGIRDLYPTPPLPPEISQYIERGSEDLSWDESSTWKAYWKDWQSILRDMENLLDTISSEEEKKLRYFSIRGLLSFTAGLHSSTAKNFSAFGKWEI